MAWQYLFSSDGLAWLYSLDLRLGCLGSIHGLDGLAYDLAVFGILEWLGLTEFIYDFAVFGLLEWLGLTAFMGDCIHGLMTWQSLGYWDSLA